MVLKMVRKIKNKTCLRAFKLKNSIFKVLTTGKSEIHGELNGEKRDTSESPETEVIFVESPMMYTAQLLNKF
jgi:hypothetical protein